MVKPPKIVRRPLPPLYVDIAEFELLEEMASAHGMTTAGLLKSLISDVVKPPHGKRLVVLHVPDWTYQTFLTFFEDDESLALASMVGHIENGAEDFATALRSAKAE